MIATGNVPLGVTYFDMLDLAYMDGGFFDLQGHNTVSNAVMGNMGDLQAAAIASGVVGVVDKGVDAVQEGRLAAIKEYQ